MRKQQQGITLIGMLLTAIVVILAGILVMRVIPVYLQFHSVKSSIRALNSLDPSSFGFDTAANAAILRKRLINQFGLNGIDDIKFEKLNIVPKGPRNYSITAQYTDVRPLFYNVSLMFKFETTQEVSIGK